MATNTGFEVKGLDIEGLDEEGNPTGYIVTTNKGNKKTLKPEQFGPKFREANQDKLIEAMSRYKNNPPQQTQPEKPAQKLTSQAAEAGSQQPEVMDQPETGEGNAPVDNPMRSADVVVEEPQSPTTVELTDTSKSTQSQTQQTMVPNELIEQGRKIAKKRGEVALTAADAEVSANNAIAALNTKNALELEQDNFKMQARRNEQESQYKEALDLSMEFVNELRNQDVEAGRWWTEGGTGRKVGAAISILLGGLGQALTGAQENAAWKIIEGAIDRDIMAQKANLKKADLAAGRANEIVSQLRQKQLGDAEIDKLFRLHKLQALESNLEAVAAASKNPAVLAKYQDAQLKLQAEQNQIEQELSKKVTTTVINNQERTREQPIKTGVDADRGIKTPAAVATRLINTKAIVDGLDDAIANIDMKDTGAFEVASRVFSKKLMQYGIFTDEEEAKEFARTNQLLSRVVVAASGAATTDQERSFYESFMPMFARDPRLAKASAEELARFMKREFNSVLDSAQKLENKGVMGLEKFDVSETQDVRFKPAGQ